MTPKISVALLLHFYQPWWQFPATLKTIVTQCYLPIFRWLQTWKGFAFSANIHSSLLQLLAANSHEELIGLMRSAVADGKVELFGSDDHHVIHPLLPKAIARLHIEKGGSIKQSLDFPLSTCNGFYLPEYAYDGDCLENIYDAGYRMVVADDQIYGFVNNHVPFNRIPRVNDTLVFLRSHMWGDRVGRENPNFLWFRPWLEYNVSEWLGEKSGYIVIATDAETFGHHHHDLIERWLLPVITAWGRDGAQARIRPFAEIASMFPAADAYVPPSSWGTEVSEFLTGDFFPLWKSMRRNVGGERISQNDYHERLWELVKLTFPFAHVTRAQEDVLQSHSSCHWWWVSAKASEWKPEFMMFGAKKALDAIRGAGSLQDVTVAENAYRNLIALPGIPQKYRNTT